MDILVKGKTGSGKTRLMISKAGDFVSRYHRVFHLVPLRSLAIQLYQRYSQLYGDIVGNNFDKTYKIYVFTYNQFNQFLSLHDNPSSATHNDVIIFDEYSLIANKLFSHVIYSSIANTTGYRRYFISATPVDISVKFDDVIDLGENGSQYEIIKVDDWRKYVDPGKYGFIYVHSTELTRTMCLKLADFFMDGVDVDTDDPVLGQLLRKGVAYYNSQMSASDREKVSRLLELGEIKVICTTTALNYGVDYHFDYGIFTSNRYLDKTSFIQFAGRVGRRGKGVIYVTFDVRNLSDPAKFTPTEYDIDFAKMIGGDTEYICKKYGICDHKLLKSIAYHLVHPVDAKRIMDFDYYRIDSDDYRLCVLSYLMRPSSLDVAEECNAFGVMSDRELYGLFKRAINLDKIGYGEYKLLQEASYKAHIMALFKDDRYDDISLALRYGIPLENVREIARLIDIPYIGRMRAYKLFRSGVTRYNLCSKRDIIRDVLGEKLADKIFHFVCTSNSRDM
ncbi:putative superfamily 2 helicase [Sulfolobus filamentous virus 1]|uniref:Putative superfamily 2 helicase n=2 Tax=Alphalipothrixvirus beppuense TaxID=2734584 RepID=A0A346LU91_SUFV1|nr:putative superfamily 2 helicase [Sulfolobus filamentous virus 1]AXQ00134.1 putative superfamily 2 helicase [Sulfolobus filamentous virus 1]AZI75754.1 putative superfamily 2 helicase [Sulfolobales Beppu filamentous phage 1]